MPRAHRIPDDAHRCTRTWGVPEWPYVKRCTGRTYGGSDRCPNHGRADDGMLAAAP